MYNIQGVVVAESRTGAANLYANFDGALSEIEAACDILLAHFKATNKTDITKQDCFLSLGCAGAGIDSVQKQFALWQHSYAAALLNTDVHTLHTFP